MRVPAEGPKNAKIMVLGESPGNNEWKRGKPFIGESGDLINDVFQAGGVPRSDIYITNVIKDHLPPWGDKKRGFFFQAGHPTKAYLDGIIEVMKEIREVQPNVVMPLGNYALWAMMQHEGISKWRGSILEAKTVEGQKVIPSIHPAFFINARNMWHKVALLEWDFQRVVRESAFPEIRSPNPAILVDPTPQEIEEAVERFTHCDTLMIDTEWYNPNSLAYIGFADSKDYAVVIPNTSMAALRAYRAILGSDVPKDTQNGWAFDIPALSRQGIEVVNPGDDLMVAWASCWASLRAKGLDTICSLLTDQPYYKDEVEFVGRDEEKGQYYCGTDCVVQFESLEKVHKEEFPITNGNVGYAISKSAAPFFIEATKTGILLDNEKRIQLKNIHLEKADELEDALSQTLGYTINCRSSKQVISLVHDQLLPAYGIKRSKRTSKQEYLMDIAGSTNVEAVQLILGSIIRVRQNRNIVSRYLHDGVVDADGRARTNWNLAGTRSGRFSSTIPWWPGLAFQTVPEDARGIFIADPGYVFIGFDYRQAEAVVVAVLTYNYDLLDDLAAGVDIHTRLAADLGIFNLTEEELLAKIAKLVAEGKGKDDCRERFLSKKSRHAFNYVEGPDTFALSINRAWIDTKIGISRTEARTIRKKYLELNPGLEIWWDQVKKTLYDQKYIDNSFGRRRYILGRMTADLHREMVSYEPQSTVGDLCTQSIVKVCRALPYAQVFLHVHDSGMFQVPEEKKDEAYEVMMREIVWPIRVGKEEVTIKADGKTGYSWGDMH